VPDKMSTGMMSARPVPGRRAAGPIYLLLCRSIEAVPNGSGGSGTQLSLRRWRRLQALVGCIRRAIQRLAPATGAEAFELAGGVPGAALHTLCDALHPVLNVRGKRVRQHRVRARRHHGSTYPTPHSMRARTRSAPAARRGTDRMVAWGGRTPDASRAASAASAPGAPGTARPPRTQSAARAATRCPSTRVSMETSNSCRSQPQTPRRKRQPLATLRTSAMCQRGVTGSAILGSSRQATAHASAPRDSRWPSPRTNPHVCRASRTHPRARNPACRPTLPTLPALMPMTCRARQLRAWELRDSPLHNRLRQGLRAVPERAPVVRPAPPLEPRPRARPRPARAVLSGRARGGGMQACLLHHRVR